MNKEIEIVVMRVSSNGSSIEFIINCPKDYDFTVFEIEVVGQEDKYSVAEGLFVPGTHHYVGQIPVESLGQTLPQIYKIHLEAEHVEEYDTDIDNNVVETPCDQPAPVIEAEVFISDVSQVYSCLMDGVISLNSKCTDSEVLDDIIRKYLILYAHQEALRYKLPEEAIKYFHMMDNCFNPCKGHGRNVSCGCGCGTKPVQMPKPKSSCGCSR